MPEPNEDGVLDCRKMEEGFQECVASEVVLSVQRHHSGRITVIRKQADTAGHSCEINAHHVRTYLANVVPSPLQSAYFWKSQKPAENVFFFTKLRKLFQILASPLIFVVNQSQMCRSVRSVTQAVFLLSFFLYGLSY